MAGEVDVKFNTHYT